MEKTSNDSRAPYYTDSDCLMGEDLIIWMNAETIMFM